MWFTWVANISFQASAAIQACKEALLIVLALQYKHSFNHRKVWGLRQRQVARGLLGVWHWLVPDSWRTSPQLWQGWGISGWIKKCMSCNTNNEGMLARLEIYYPFTLTSWLTLSMFTLEVFFVLYSISPIEISFQEDAEFPIQCNLIWLYFQLSKCNSKR